MENEYPSPGPSSRKSHKVIWGFAIFFLVIFAGYLLFYFLNKDDKPEPAASANTSSQSTTSTPAFEPVDTATQPYAAKLTTTVDGTPKSATLLSDGQGNYSYTFESEGQTLSTIYTADAYYVCTGQDTCMKYPLSNTTANNNFDPSQYQYDQSRLEELKNSASYKGQEPCPGGKGTCDVWEVKGDQTNTTVKLFIDPNTKRIMKAVYSTGTTTNEVTYEYKDVEVAVPVNFTGAP